jgi:thiamine kinase-like enzyme
MSSSEGGGGKSTSDGNSPAAYPTASTTQVYIPSQRQKLSNKIRHTKALPGHLQSKTLAALETMPDGDQVCHGDFHPGNILMTPQGEIIIDWIDASRGNPLADLARTTVLALGAAETSQIQNPLLKAFIHIFHTAYIHHSGDVLLRIHTDMRRHDAEKHVLR